MSRKRLTEIFPYLLPFRKAEKKFFFYLKMKFDGHHYSETVLKNQLPFKLFEARSNMFNKYTGFDASYQTNKAHNLRLAAAKLDGMIVYPGETFSLCQAIRNADKEIPYKNGLILMNGRWTTAYGGGLCQISSLLFWLFLHSPLTIIERHGHGIQNFPYNFYDGVKGVDAAIYEGWLDLKAKNDTDYAFQIKIEFNNENIIGQLFAQRDIGLSYSITNGNTVYYRKNGKIYEETDILRSIMSDMSNQSIAMERLYRNKCQIGYELPSNTLIDDKYI